MILLKYASSRIKSVLDEIARLEGIEFPYPHSSIALQKIRNSFEDALDRVSRLDEKSNPEVAKKICAKSLVTLFHCLPVLGFILRSTDVRNSFEAVRPLLHISEKLINPRTGNEKTRLILSSEWSYSPFTYHQIPDLPGFVLIGLPSTESENPLLIPLSGHELGHALWAAKELENEFKPSFREEIITYIVTNKEKYKKQLGKIGESNDLNKELRKRGIALWGYAVKLVMEQAKETFCDFIGLNIFGSSFLYAHAYLFAPNVSSPRSVKYPKPLKRINYQIRAANKYGFDIPENFEGMFRERPASLLAPSEKFQLAIADDVLKKKVGVLIDKAQDLIQEANIPKPDEEESLRIYERFELIVPAENCKDLADILNAAWKAYNNPKLWEDMEKFEKEKEEFEKKKERILKDLVLKTIEVFEVEHLLKGDA